jgi:UDP-N-acetyl-2-amino-2-deoxyglucuronate dehydrogenase
VGRSRTKMAAQHEGAKLMCVCDLLEEKCKAAAEEYGCDWTTNYEEMLGRDDIDAIGVFSPSGMHADHGIMAAEAGKHVFTTKPMDIRVEKCDALIAACEKGDRMLAVDFGRRYDEDAHKARMALHGGKLGKPLAVDVRMKWLREQSYYDGGMPEGWRCSLKWEGGSIANQGVHQVDLLYWLFGPVKSVYGRMGTFAHEIETEDMCNALLTFKSGTWGIIQTSTCNRPNLGTEIEVTGTKGTLTFTDKGITTYVIDGDEDASIDEFVPDPKRPKNIIEDVVGTLTEGSSLMCDGHEGKVSTQIFCAVYESARTGKAVEL